MSSLDSAEIKSAFHSFLSKIPVIKYDLGDSRLSSSPARTFTLTEYLVRDRRSNSSSGVTSTERALSTQPLSYIILSECASLTTKEYALCITFFLSLSSTQRKEGNPCVPTGSLLLSSHISFILSIILLLPVSNKLFSKNPCQCIFPTTVKLLSLFLFHSGTIFSISQSSKRFLFRKYPHCNSRQIRCPKP